MVKKTRMPAWGLLAGPEEEERFVCVVEWRVWCEREVWELRPNILTDDGTEVA